MFLVYILKAGFINLICCDKLYPNALQISVKPLPVSYLKLVFIQVSHALYTHSSMKVTLRLWVHQWQLFVPITDMCKLLFSDWTTWTGFNDVGFIFVVKKITYGMVTVKARSRERLFCKITEKYCNNTVGTSMPVEPQKHRYVLLVTEEHLFVILFKML